MTIKGPQTDSTVFAGSGVTIPEPPAPGIELEQETDARLQTVVSSDEEWRQRLTPEQYTVLRKAGTERPFSGQYVDTDDDGLYRCAACGNPLFDSEAKFHSGTGWPSFTESVSPQAVELITDRSHGMVRTEVQCSRCHSHLGHLFDDGPAAAGSQRWCMNSAALELQPR
jgi:peptide-methionine (R)-S-oxide reductase